MIVAACSDAIDYTIPHRVIISLLVLYPAFVMTSAHDIDWLMASAISAGALAVGILLYATRKVGAGDVKMISATLLWAGTEHSVAFILIMSISGAMLSAAKLVRNNYGWVIGYERVENAVENTMVKVPYGVAIAFGGLFVAAKLIINAQPV